MSQLSLTSPSAPSFPPLAYKGIPVLTTEMLAQAYRVAPKQIRQNFANNRERFIEGKHFFIISGNELREFKNCVENFDSVQIGKRTASVTLYTDRGCARHAKSLNTDRAWDMYELLEETFFSVAKAAQSVTHPVTLNDSSMTPEQQARLHVVVDAKVSMVPKPYRRQAYKEIWTRFNRHFQIARYVQLPTEKVEEGIEYLLAMQVNAGKARALEQVSLPPAERYSFTMFSGNDCLEFAREIEEAHKKVFDLYEGLRVKGIKISIKLMDEVENRARKGCRCGGWPGDGFDRIFSQLMTASLCDALLYVERELPSYRNPGMTLYSLAMGMNPASRANGRA